MARITSTKEVSAAKATSPQLFGVRGEVLICLESRGCYPKSVELIQGKVKSG